jgi:hypothetical protein
MVNDPDLAVRAAVDGLAIAYTLEPLAEPFLRSEQLVQVLGNWSPSFEGLYLYYPGHRRARPHRHDPRGRRLDFGQAFARESFRDALSASKPSSVDEHCSSRCQICSHCETSASSIASMRKETPMTRIATPIRGLPLFIALGHISIA